MQVRKFFLLILIIPIFNFSLLCPGIRSALDAIKVITINSISQKIINKNHVLLEGDVEILLDYKIQIMADKVEIDKEKKTIIARADPDCLVKLENPDFVMLAEYIELNLDTRTGSAENLKIHVKDGFVSAALAKKVDDQTWEMNHIRYTSCDHSRPHWVFIAHKAILYRNSVLKASGLLFKINEIPIFVFPGLVFPLQNRAGSGFLIPRLSFDAELGFGFKQEYYWLLGSHCDTTIGFNLVEEKGFIFSDEFRWARGPENFFIVNSYYAEEWDALLEKKGQIISAKDKHYWVQGNYFHPFTTGSIDFQNLIRFDFGTDKKIGYRFLNDTECVEDSFENTAICRHQDRKNMVECLVHSERSLRKQFTDVSDGNLVKQKEREEKVTINYLPRCEWNTVYYKILSRLFYRHDLLIDHAYLESREKEKLYIDGCLSRTEAAFSPIDIEAARFLYRGQVRSSVRFLDQSVTGFVEPHVHVRTNVKNEKSHYKNFARYGVEWALPERTLANSDHSYIHHLQPLMRWSCLQKFAQSHWYYIDKFDRFYPENRIELVLQNNWQLRSWDIDLYMSQGYDFYNKSDIFPLRRCYNQQHLSPFYIYAACSSTNNNRTSLSIQLTQEYSWKTLSLMQSELSVVFSWGKYDFFLAYLYQKSALQRSRELFSDIPTFALIGCTFPLGKSLQIHYNGNFYAKRQNIKPLLHRLCLNYEGHCWGLAIGFEEKRYKQYGKWKSERAITLSLRLESVGSFAQKFRRPVVSKAHRHYFK